METITLPATHITSEEQVTNNSLLVYEKDNVFTYLRVESGIMGGTPYVNMHKHPNIAVFLLIGELRSKGIKLYKLEYEA